jgi:hypothetical protein
MRYYEIINPSDKVVLSADESDELILSIAIIILGKGKAGLQRDDDQDIVPLMFFGGFEDWLVSKGLTPDSFDETLQANRSKIATILETVFYGSIEEAKALDAALAGLPREHALAARAKYNDAKRGSLSDWGAACLNWARKLRRPPSKRRVTQGKAP